MTQLEDIALRIERRKATLRNNMQHLQTDISKHITAIRSMDDMIKIMREAKKIELDYELLKSFEYSLCMLNEILPDEPL